MPSLQTRIPIVVAIAALSSITRVAAQDWLFVPVAFTIGPNSVNVGRPSSTPGVAIDSGILLTPFGPPGPGMGRFRLPAFGPALSPLAPLLAVPPSQPGVLPGGPPNGSAVTWAASDHVDAISLINWRTWWKVRVISDARWLFSVAPGSIGNAAVSPNELATEAAGAQAHADIYQTDVPMLFLPIATPPFGNELSIDGNGGLNAPPEFGFGLVERPAANDDLSGFSVVSNTPRQLIYHSLTSEVAAAYGYSGAHVFWHNPTQFQVGGTIVPRGTQVFMTPVDFGLSPDDDVDAFVVHENGITGYQRGGGVVRPDGTVPPEANGNAQNGGVAIEGESGGGGGGGGGGPGPGPGESFTPDQVFFSVTPESPIVGTIDGALGVPINPGDILTVPSSPGTPGAVPRIVVLAELLGLRTVRTAPFLPALMDDIDALDDLPAGYYDEAGEEPVPGF